METAASLNDSGIVLTEANRPSDAIPLFQKALILEPGNPLLWLNLGIAQHRLGEYDEAEQSFQRCRAIDDDCAEAWSALGLLLYEQERYEEAEAYYRGALSRDDTGARCWNNLGVLYFSEGGYDEARECFERAVTLDPLYYDGLFNLRDACSELGDERAAAEFGRRLRELSSGGLAPGGRPMVRR
jgi:tetratricopeptide (TPR) repeat protein